MRRPPSCGPATAASFDYSNSNIENCFLTAFEAYIRNDLNYHNDNLYYVSGNAPPWSGEYNTVVNLENHTTSFDVLFFDDNGFNLDVPVSGQGVVHGMTISLQTAGTFTFRPTHLDSHMFALFQSPELFMIFMKVAHDYDLPYLAARTGAPSHMLNLLEHAYSYDIIADRIIMADDNVSTGKLREWYMHAAKALEPGLTQLIVHPGINNTELASITQGRRSFGSAWREQDFKTVLCSEFAELLNKEKVFQVNWSMLSKAVAQAI